MTRLSVLLSIVISTVAACGDDGAVDSGADSGPDDTGTMDGAPDAGDGGDAGDTGDSGMAVAWALVGGQVSSPDAESEDPEMMLIDGAPAVGYRHASFRVHLHDWDGTTWGDTAPDPTGGEATSSIHRAPDFCWDGSRIFMAYTHAGDASASDASFYDRVFLYRYTTGAGWAPMNGGAEISQGLDGGGVGYNASEATVDCRASVDPVVGWVETDLVADGDDDGHVATVTATSVESSPRIDVVTMAGTDHRVLDVALASDGGIFAALFEHSMDASFETQLNVVRFSAALELREADVDRDSDSNGLAPPSIAVRDSDGALFLAWSADADDGDNRHVYVARADAGGAFATLGGGPLSFFGDAHFDSSDPDLILVDGEPVVAFAEANDDGQYVFVARYVGSGFEFLGGPTGIDPPPYRPAGDPTLAFDAGSRSLYVAYEALVDGFTEIFVAETPLAD